MIKTKNGVFIPESGDESDEVYAAIISNFYLLDSHRHDGITSQKISGNVYAPPSQIVESTEFVQNTLDPDPVSSDRAYSAIVDLPDGVTAGDFHIDIWEYNSQTSTPVKRLNDVGVQRNSSTSVVLFYSRHDVSMRLLFG